MPNMRWMGKSLGLKLKVIDAITDFRCLPFFPHLVSITATQNQERGTSGAWWDYIDRSTGPEGRGAVFTLFTLPRSPRLSGYGTFLRFSIAGL